MVRRSLKRGGRTGPDGTLSPTEPAPAAAEGKPQLTEVEISGKLKPLLGKTWAVPIEPGEGVRDEAFKSLQAFVLSKLPDNHKKAAEKILIEIDKTLEELKTPPPTEGGSKRAWRSMRGGVLTPLVYLKCCVYALLLVIIDGLSATPSLILTTAIVAGAGVSIVGTILTVVAGNITVIGSATLAATLTSKIISVYTQLTTPRRYGEAPGEDDVAEEVVPQSIQSLMRTDLAQPAVPLGTQPFVFVPNEAAIEAAYAEEGEIPPAVPMPATPLHFFVREIMGNPKLAATLTKALDPPESLAASAIKIITRTFLFIFAVFYLRKLIEVISKEEADQAAAARVERLNNPGAAVGPAALVLAAAPAAAAIAPLVLVAAARVAPAPAAPGAPAAAPGARPRRPSMAQRRAIQAAAAAALGIDPGEEADAASGPGRGGRRRTRRNRHRRHRPSAPTRKGSSYSRCLRGSTGRRRG